MHRQSAPKIRSRSIVSRRPSSHPTPLHFSHHHFLQRASSSHGCEGSAPTPGHPPRPVHINFSSAFLSYFAPPSLPRVVSRRMGAPRSLRPLASRPGKTFVIFFRVPLSLHFRVLVWVHPHACLCECVCLVFQVYVFGLSDV